MAKATAVQIEYDGWDDYEVRLVLSSGDLVHKAKTSSVRGAEQLAQRLAASHGILVERNYSHR